MNIASNNTEFHFKLSYKQNIKTRLHKRFMRNLKVDNEILSPL